MSFALFPFSILYCSVAILKKILPKEQDFDIPIISVGNLTVGGSGKTPIVAALARRYDKCAIVLRGFHRHSKGLRLVSNGKSLLCNAKECGDEAVMLAQMVPNAVVIVCERREEGIEKAKGLGCNVLFLDDAFHKPYKKFDILIDIKTPNRLCLPSGPYRLPRAFLKKADLVVQEERDFLRNVWISNPKKKMVLLTAIAYPKRVLRYVPKGTKAYFFEDHHHFTKEELEQIWHKEKPDAFLVTRKDAVKLEQFSYPLSILELELTISKEVYEKVDRYIKEYDAKKDSNRSDTA
ncbi:MULTISPECIES: tetraacyldisaccharide 4'-kinase [unclassified Nitratiruptor]|uniref:tetraacyldisaccharide 4'-kinase n=1 Tax=Nitratiruptor sp. YY08-10 TaxID=2724897 RepID=UPI001F34BBA2|nr:MULTISPECIES: tetraacyldisaccharide 4'-kinase [unclassified Nitratiruptor]